jgi:LIVCS family branched-chain amino acid:cation transporter
MQKASMSQIISLGLAIFSMLFGAGNLMYPLMVGMTAGKYTVFGMFGFLLSAVCLPLLGLITMIFFDGDYKAFFRRLGNNMGNIFIGGCMLIIGPVIAIPRITTLSHIMIAPFIPIPFLQQEGFASSFVFALIFLGVTFLATFRESKIIDVLGKVISPLLVISLAIIIIKGLFTAETAVATDQTALTAFTSNFIRGYETLDLLGGIFFASIVITLLKVMYGSNYDPRTSAKVGLQAGFIGTGILALIYIGMSFLGMYHGHGMQNLHAGELFRVISFNVLGFKGSFIIGTAVLMACLSTAIALSATVADYLQKTLFHGKISFIMALTTTLLACIPLSIFGLGKVLALTGGPLVYIGTPVIITLTCCNLAYKLWNFQLVKIPVLITFIGAVISYYAL